MLSSLKTTNETLNRELSSAHTSLVEMTSRIKTLESRLNYLQTREHTRELEEKEKEDRRKMRRPAYFSAAVLEWCVCVVNSGLHQRTEEQEPCMAVGLSNARG